MSSVAATKSQVQRLACTIGLRLYPRSQGPTTGDLWQPPVNRFQIYEEGHRQDAEMCGQIKSTFNEHFEMEGLHTIQQVLYHNDLITKADLFDVYMHCLISEVDCTYMQFMWEGTK